MLDAWKCTELVQNGGKNHHLKDKLHIKPSPFIQFDILLVPDWMFLLLFSLIFCPFCKLYQTHLLSCHVWTELRYELAK